MTSAGCVNLNDVYATDAAGMETHYAIAMIQMAEDGRLVHSEEFEAEDLDQAIARFDELTTRRNEASDGLRRFYKTLIEDRDLDAAMAMADEGLIVDDRRPLVGSEIGQDDFSANFATILDHDGDIDWSLDVLAVIGYRFATARVTIMRRPIDFASDVLVVVEMNEAGLATAIVAFNPDDLDAALAEMERRSTEAESAD